MPQAAQQDYLRIECGTAANALTSEVKNKLIACIEAGTILDAVLELVPAANHAMSARVVSYDIDSTTSSAPKYTIGIADCQASTAAVVKIALN